MTTKEEQAAVLIGLLWDSLKHDPDHKDRRQTGWGTKTQAGLFLSVQRIMDGHKLPKGNE